MLTFRMLPSSSTFCSYSAEQAAQHGFVHFVADFDAVVAIHDHFRLDHRHQARFLAQRGVARQRVAVGLDRGGAGVVFADVDHRAPLGELGTQLDVLLQTLAQAVQALGHHIARKAGQRHRALVHLDARDDAVLLHHLGEGHAVLGGLADGFVIEDRAGDVLAQARSGEQQLAVGAAVLFAVLDADRFETLLDGVGRLVDGDDALAGRNHRQGDAFKIFDAHDDSVERGDGPWPRG